MFPAEAAWVSEPCKQKAVQSSEREKETEWIGGGWGGGGSCGEGAACGE